MGRLTVLLVSLTAAASVQAQEWKFFGAFSIDPSDRDSITLSNGRSASTSEGVHVKAGVEWPVPQGRGWGGQLSVGFKSNVTDSGLFDRSRAVFYSAPVEAILFYHVDENMRFGAGASYHLNPTASCVENHSSQCDGVADIEFDNAHGAVVEADYVVQDVLLGVRYVDLDYKVDGQRVDGGGIGFLLGVRFSLSNLFGGS